jgi:hypothetical protein
VSRLHGAPTARGGVSPTERGGVSPTARGGVSPTERGGVSPTARGGVSPTEVFDDAKLLKFEEQIALIPLLTPNYVGEQSIRH